jgi:hypothetical protein
MRDIVGAAQRPERPGIEGQRAHGLATLLVNVLKVCEDDLAQGAMISVTENGARIIRLPLLR